VSQHAAVRAFLPDVVAAELRSASRQTIMLEQTYSYLKVCQEMWIAVVAPAHGRFFMSMWMCRKSLQDANGLVCLALP